MKHFTVIILVFLFSFVLNAQNENQSKTYNVKKQKEDVIIFENFNMTFYYTTSSSVEIPDSLKRLLPSIVKYLKKGPNSIIQITGHSDNSGTMDENHQLSLKRAENVAKYLKSKGIKAIRILANGLGSLEPIASNNTEDGKIKNSRVVIRIIPSAKEFMKNK